MAYNSENNTPDISSDNNVYYGADAVCKTLALLLKSRITWLQKSFGRTRMVYRDKDSQPLLYVGGGEYYPVLPNDAYKSYAFWNVYGAQISKDETNVYNTQTLFNADVSLIVWCNLNAIDPANDSIFTSKLEKDILGTLKTSPYFTFSELHDDSMLDIYANLNGYFSKAYWKDTFQRDLLMYPFQAFRIDGVINYNLNYCA